MRLGFLFLYIGRGKSVLSVSRKAKTNGQVLPVATVKQLNTVVLQTTKKNDQHLSKRFMGGGEKRMQVKGIRYYTLKFRNTPVNTN